MLNAASACAIADSKKADAYGSVIFNHAINKLEESIREAASRGKHEICFNICYFDIRPFSSLQKDTYATQAEREAIRDYMIENGYDFFFHSVMSIGGRFNPCFTCRW